MSLSQLASNAIAAHTACFAPSGSAVVEDEAFRRSAVATALALDAGVAALHLAQEFKYALADHAEVTSSVTYTSPTAVCYHARAGRLLLLPGPRPSVCARDVQSLVRRMSDKWGARVVDQVLGCASSQRHAYMVLERLAVQPPPARRATPVDHERGLRKLLRALEAALLAAPSIDPELLDELEDLLLLARSTSDVHVA